MDELSRLAQRFGSDKFGHGFCGFYDDLLSMRKGDLSKVLEIGVGDGCSLLMWREYFDHARILGLDVSPRVTLETDRVALYRGDQASRRSLNDMIARFGSDFDFILDDGGHTMEQQQVSLGFLFPHLRPGGLYVIEDLHTSFSKEIIVHVEGKTVNKYSTGVMEDGISTFDFVDALLRGQQPSSRHLSASEIDYVVRHVSSARIFDRDGDHKHITSAIHKSASNTT